MTSVAPLALHPQAHLWCSAPLRATNERLLKTSMYHKSGDNFDVSRRRGEQSQEAAR